MTPARFSELTQAYPNLRVGVLGDFCLDRYLEIEPARLETSLETGLPVHNVGNVRAQPGGAGTIVNNLSALGIGSIYPVGFLGWDAEGFELWRALRRLPGVRLKHFIRTEHRRTFTYCKPLLLAPDKPAVELNRLDFKNWSPTPALVQGQLLSELVQAADALDALVILDQVDVPETGVVTQKVLETVRSLVSSKPRLIVLADSRRGLRGYPPVMLKMNATELASLMNLQGPIDREAIQQAAATLARTQGREVFVTLAEGGMSSATSQGHFEHVPALPLRGEIDVVGAGDAVSANLLAGLAAGASAREALEIANAAASVVIHKLGTTGTASVDEIARLMESGAQTGSPAD
jgi:rfaE bifunctional protein kinase chain/domain